MSLLKHQNIPHPCLLTEVARYVHIVSSDVAPLGSEAFPLPTHCKDLCLATDSLPFHRILPEVPGNYNVLVR